MKAKTKWEKRLARAATASVRETGIRARDAARQIVATSGLGPNWEDSFVSSMHPKRGDVMNPWAWVHSRINFASVFEQGAQISPKTAKYIWIPTIYVPKYPGTGTAKAPLRQMSPKKYTELVGPLKFVTPPGKAPMLISQVAGSVMGMAKRRQYPRHGIFNLAQSKKRLQWVPMFIGVKSVTIGGRWGVKGAMAMEIAKLPQTYKKVLSETRIES